MARKSNAERNAEKAAQLFSKIGAATLLMMWGVVNTVFNLFTYIRVPAEARPDFTATAVGIFLVMLTGVAPFVFGLVWLWRLMDGPAKPNSSPPRK